MSLQPPPVSAGPRGLHWAEHPVRGVTLVELMVTVAVFAIVASLAAPSFVRTIASNRLSTQTNDFVASLNLARSEAVRRGQGVTLRSTNAGSPELFHGGWVVETDSDADGAAPSTVTEANGTVLRDSGALAGTTHVTRVTRSVSGDTTTYSVATGSMANRGYVVFNSRGGHNGGGSAFFRLCDSSDSTIRARIVQVSAVGRITLDSTNETCP